MGVLREGRFPEGHRDNAAGVAPTNVVASRLAAKSRKTVRGLFVKEEQTTSPQTLFHIEGFLIVKYAWGKAKKQPG
jgi:hypothetical protein